MTNLPTGEQLPDYPDDDTPASPAKLLDWLRGREPQRWGIGAASGADGALTGGKILGASPDLISAVAENLGAYERQIIADVLGALAAVSDAQLVKNATYRTMARDRAELEALSAFLANHGYARELVEYDGRPGMAAASVIAGYARAAEAQARAERRVIAAGEPGNLTDLDVEVQE